MSNDIVTEIVDRLSYFAEQYDKIADSRSKAEQAHKAALAANRNRISEELRHNDKRIQEVTALNNIARGYCTQQQTDAAANVSAKRYDKAELMRIAVNVDGSPNGLVQAARLLAETEAQLKWLRDNRSEINSSESRSDFLTDELLSTDSELALLDTEALESQLKEFLASHMVRAYKSMLNDHLNRYCNDNLLNTSAQNTLITLGLIYMPVRVPSCWKSLVKAAFGDTFFDMERCALASVLSADLSCGGVIFCEFGIQNESALVGGFQRMIFNAIAHCPKMLDEVMFVDPIRLNSSYLGHLAVLAKDGSSLIRRVPSTVADCTRDVNDLLKRCNFHEFDEPRRIKLIVLWDFPNGYDTSVVRSLCANARNFALNIVICSRGVDDRGYRSNELEDIISMSMKINCIDGRSVIYNRRGTEYVFRWFDAPHSIPAALMNALPQPKAAISDFVYQHHFPLKFSAVARKGVRRLTDIPYGIDSDGALQYLSFEDENFATFICGVSRSGKSTLLHTILIGLFAKTNPDDVEVWLIDFKMTEFSKYIGNIPPHVRYIILDDSPDIVFNIIDRLTEILIKRQNAFMGKWDKLSDVPKDRYMPAMFVVIDEFSVMSSVIIEHQGDVSGDYIAKLQLLLAKGAALGMHFIFANQGYENGTKVLNEMSKNQIQQRIAMKAPRTDIKATLDLKSVSDTDDRMMNELEKHHTLLRVKEDSSGNHLKQAHVLFISDEAERERYIADISNAYHTQAVFASDDDTAYIDKRQLVVDGNSYKAFSVALADIRKQLFSGASEDALRLYIGEPRKMVQHVPVTLTDTFCENILMVAPIAEADSAASALASAMITAGMQAAATEVWSSRGNAVVTQLGKIRGVAASFEQGLDAVCGRIDAIKADISAKKPDKKIIVITACEELMNDMTFVIPYDSSQSAGGGFVAASSGHLTIEQQIAMQLGEAPTVSQPEPVVPAARDARDDLKFLLTQGPSLGYHFVVMFNSAAAVSQNKLDASLMRHKIFFRTSRNELMGLVSSMDAALVTKLKDRMFRYSNGLVSASYRPYIHAGVPIDGWEADGSGNAVHTEKEVDYLM